MRVIVVLPMILSLIMFLATSGVQASVILQANGATPATTFSFNVGPYVADVDSNAIALYTGRSDATVPFGIDNGVSEYAISAAVESLDTVFPYAPYNVRLDGVDNQTNPLFGQKISLLGLFYGTPFAVTAAAPQNIYWNKSRLGVVPGEVSSGTNVLDASGAVNANGAVTAGISSAVGAAVSEVTSAGQIAGNYIFAAVQPNGAAGFGAAGSGLAVLMNAGSTLQQLAPVTGDTGIKASPIDGTQSYVKINSNATIGPNSVVDVYFDAILNRVYIIYSAQAGAGVADGVRGIVMGYVNPVTTIGVDGKTTVDFKLILTDFVPATAFTGAGTTRVAGVTGANAVITLSKFRSLYTSTGLTYGILVGSSTGANATTTVSAIPLVNKSVDSTNITWPTDPTHGAMASRNINPGVNLQTFFNPQFLIRPYSGRGFQVPASALADIPVQSDPAVAVGAGVAPGVIQAIQAYKDTVFISTLAGAADAGGIFSSQALFDGSGAIKSWTPWQRVAFSSTPGTSIFGFAYQPTLGKMFSLQGLTATTVDIIATSTWSDHNNDNLLGGTATDASVGFIDLINKQFPPVNGGIQAILDFPKNTDGFAAAPNRLSAMVFTGNKQIVLVQTGSDDGAGVFTPQTGDFSTNMEISTNGAVVTPGAGALIVSVSGGVLNTLGSITSATIINDGVANAYLVVGGVGGVAVLTPGWPTAGLRKNFTNLPASAFTLIGSYTNVRKLVNDGTNLYVLTNQTFDRIPAAQLGGGPVAPVTLATGATVGTHGSFSDTVVSGKLALLATSNGLLRAGNGANVATATQAADMGWIGVPLVESQVSVTRIFPYSTTGLAQDFSGAGASGQLYVLSACVSQGLASVYRIAISDTRTNPIVSTTVQVIPDYFVQSTTNPYVALGAYRNYFRTDGALFTDSRSSGTIGPVTFQSFPPFLRTGVIYYPRMAKNIPIDPTNGTTVGNLVRNSGLGSLILPTGGGMQVLE